MNADRIPTLLVNDDDEDGAIAPVLYQTVPFSSASAEHFAEVNAHPRPVRFYRRYGNPTLHKLEKLVARLEGAEAALVTASGVGAISTALIALTSAGDHVVGQRSMYAGTLALIQEVAPRLGIDTTVVNQVSVDDFDQALRPETRLILLESPSNPLLQLTDLAAVTDLARSRGIVTLVDNTIASPINQRPLEHGADLVMHSLTKIISGHSDVLGGVVAGSTSLIDTIWRTHIVIGSVMSPFDAWLALRGSRTLEMRANWQNRVAHRVATFLEGHSAVQQVNYPGLASHPQHDMARRQMSGYGGVTSFLLRGGDGAAKAFIAGLRLPRRSPSLGGSHSLVIQPAAMWAQDLTREQLEAAGVPPGLVRLSVGLEHEDDLISDMAQALDAIGNRSALQRAESA